MKKCFCDLCGEEAPYKRDNGPKLLERSVACDKEAKVTGSFYLSFSGHSAGYAGPPDVCDECYSKMILKFKEQALW